MKILFLKVEYLKALKALKGQFADPTHVDEIIDETTEVRTPKGDVTAIYFRDVIPREFYERACKSWRIVSERPTNRATAVGSQSLPRLKKDGTLGNRRVVPKRVVSILERRDTAHGTLGYFDATPDKPCHKTPLTKRHPEMLNRNKLLIKIVDRAHDYFLSRSYVKQRAEVD